MLYTSFSQQSLVNSSPNIASVRPSRRNSTRRVQRSRCSSRLPNKSVCVREAETDDELEICARIRASAYYEELPTPRFVINLERQFARDEFQALVRRTRSVPGVGSPRAVCIVALDAEGHVVGSLDIRPPFSKTGLQPGGVPQDPNAAFIANLAVDTRARRRGFGSALLHRALTFARQQLQADRVYAHVDGTNPATCSLYKRAGFERSSCPIDSPRSGQLVLIAEIGRVLHGK